MRSKKSGKSSNPDLRKIKALLDSRVERYNRPEFIPQDPIAIPHSYTSLQDVEITGFWTAILSWGQRKTILKKAGELFALMDNAPHEFIVRHKEKDRRRFLHFRHRTFQPTDTLYFLEFFQRYYREHYTLEDAFLPEGAGEPIDIFTSINKFHDRFFSHPFAPQRTRKHVPNPRRNSGCKRINMFLRWMVRDDNRGVDFGLWRRIDKARLMIPLDVHVQRVAHTLGLLSRPDTSWKAVEELTAVLRKLDPSDPVKYDFALFGMGVLENIRQSPFRGRTLLL